MVDHGDVVVAHGSWGTCEEGGSAGVQPDGEELNPSPLSKVYGTITCTCCKQEAHARHSSSVKSSHLSRRRLWMLFLFAFPLHRSEILASNINIIR